MNQVNVFRKALENPLEVSESEFKFLLSKYPYSQPILFAQERKKRLENQEMDTQMTLLYASNSFWLRDYLNKPIQSVPELEVDSQDYIAYEDLPEDEIETEEVAQDSQFSAQREPLVQEKMQSELDQSVESEPIFDMPSTYRLEDDFPEAPEQKVPQELEQEALQVVVHADKEPSSEDEISLYNDELMPYSFRWWLYKTRLEHAQTYQPFVSPVFPKQDKAQFDPKKLDEAILDQQIRENIFHLQDPQDKFSDAHRKETVEFVSEQKTDEVIEKFIREEPQIQPPKAESINTENKARKSSEDQFLVVTETLANIYESQGMNEKAIAVFKKLISENPEKKSYFASRIKELEFKL